MRTHPLARETTNLPGLDRFVSDCQEAAPNQASRFLLDKEPQHTTPEPATFMMDIQQLTEKMHAFVRSKGWYEADSKRPQIPRNLSISLALEAAEILEHFQWNEEYDKVALAEELADVALYLLQLASVTEIDLEQAILRKLEVNAKREWDKG